jgi:hypothetical protein
VPENVAAALALAFFSSKNSLKMSAESFLVVSFAGVVRSVTGGVGGAFFLPQPVNMNAIARVIAMQTMVREDIRAPFSPGRWDPSGTV